MKNPQLRFSLFVALILLIGVGQTALAQDSMERWQKFDFAKTSLKASDLSGVPLEDLTLMRGIVFGRHGRVFKNASIRTYLEAQDWYKPDPDFQNAMLNATENRNLDLIRVAEASKHETVMPGDMRYWLTRTLTAKKLGTQVFYYAVLRKLRSVVVWYFANQAQLLRTLNSKVRFTY